jgi:hypothetical protein
MWINADTAVEYLFFSDGDSFQWVETGLAATSSASTSTYGDSNVALLGYATNANVALKANIADLKTANVAELTNLYFTNARATSAVTNSALSNITITGNAVFNGSVTSGGLTVGYLEIPQSSQSTSYTLALADSGKHIYSQNTATQVLTIPTNANVAFNVGTAVSIVLQGSGSITVSPFSGVTLYLAGNSTSASRTISTYGMATLLKVATNTWFINGSGVS